MHLSDMCHRKRQLEDRSRLSKKGISSRSIFPELKLELDVSEEELERRRAAWQPREPKVKTGYLARYASMVTSGNRGAILEIPKNN